MALALELGQPLVTGDAEIQNAASEAGIMLHWLGD
jgi:rRNA maturation endonuclease Nob1